MKKAHVHSVESMGALDGPGIRYVLFLQGCPFRCKFCHNPDTWQVNDKKLMTAEEIYQDVLKYADFFRFSGGGFTASGGEPLLQAEFLIELFKKLKAVGISTAIDTCGYIDLNQTIDELADYTDLFMLDIKHLDFAEHLRITGKTNFRVLNFLKFLNNKQKRIWIRVVLLNNSTATPDYIQWLASFLSPYKIERIELLPFHKLGEHKWKELGINYEMNEDRAPSKELVAELAEMLRKDGYNVSTP